MKAIAQGMRKRPGHESKMETCGGKRMSSSGPAMAAYCSYSFATLQEPPLENM